MFHVLLAASRNQALSMKATVVVIATLAVLVGCATSPKKTSLQSFVGRSLADVKATYGSADFFARDAQAQRSYSFRMASSSTFVPTRIADTTGTIDRRQVALQTAYSGAAITTDSECLLIVTVDDSDTVVRASTTSDSLCARYFREG
jgi:hypothetical protein